MPDIDFQKIVLNLIPKREDDPVVFYASQYETKRQFIADLMWGDSEYAPGPDCWAEIDIRKNDDNLVVITDDVTIDNNVVSVILPVQAVTCIGKNLGQIKIYSGEDQFVAAFNFILEVQPDPLAGGVTSETAIDNLTQQIEDITQEVIGNDYYNKTETDALLADKADVSDLPDMSNYYTKDQTYSSSQIDTALSYKADASVLSDYALKEWVTLNFVDAAYLGAHYYNKNQVDDLIDGLFPTFTASGAIATFTTALNKPLVSVTAEAGATTITLCGSNLFDEERLLNATDWSKSGDYYVGSVGQLYTLFNVNGDFWHSESGVDSLCVSYTAYVDNVNVNARAEFYYSDGTTSLAGVINGSTPTDYTAVSTSGKTVIAIKWNFSNDATLHIKDFSINYPSTDTQYHPYNGQTVPVADAITLTTLSGVNNVFADSGDVTVQYKYMSM